MEITKENHTIVRVTEIATKTNVELNMIVIVAENIQMDLRQHTRKQPSIKHISIN